MDNQEEAMRKYCIPIPDDINNYDKEKYKQFDDMYIEALFTTFHSKTQAMPIRNGEDKQNIAVVLGGQAGAGKTSLIAETKRKFADKGKRIIVIDDDEYRKLYPRAEEILKEYPEMYTKITATATSKITPKILEFASQNKYNFIFEGTMKNKRIIETMKTWDDYKIYVKVMCASRLRSLASIAIRNGELRKIGIEGRFISTVTHDETYYGIPETLEYLEQTGLAEEIKIYRRGIDPLFPREEYSSLKNKGISSAQQLTKLREIDSQEFIKNGSEVIHNLEDISTNLSEEEKVEIYKTIQLIRDAMEEQNQNR